ncbi:MAG: hypothetical protein AB1925_23380 [Actinomycetota bacterium]
MGGTVSCDPDGLRAFVALCGEHANDVGVHRYPTQPPLPKQATSTAVAQLHDATERVAGNLAERIDSTAKAAAEAARMYSESDTDAGGQIEASM